MSGQRWWALLVLAAVFALHGVQCSGGGTAAAGHPTAHGVHATAVLLGGPSETSGAAPSTRSSTGHGHLADASAVGVPGVVDGGHPASDPGELWVVCLAVLSAALVGLLGLLARRRRIDAPPARWQPPPRRPGVSAVLRTPDVYSLCVLRT